MNKDVVQNLDFSTIETKKRFTTTFSLLVVMLLGFMETAFILSKDLVLVDLNTIQYKLMEFEQVSSNLKFYDEVLTSSSRLYILTKNEKWSTRYETYEILLDNEFKKIKINYPLLKFTLDTVKANDSLVKMEKMGIHLARSGNLTKANSIIYSSEYEKLKKQYKSNLLKSNEVFKQHIYNEILSLEEKSEYYDGIGFTFLLLTILGWMIVYLKFRAENLNLTKLGQILELNVAERTTQLQTETLKSKELMNHFQTLFQSTPVPIFIYNARGILDCNICAMNFLETKNKEAITSKNPLQLCPQFQPDGSSTEEVFKTYESQAYLSKITKFEFEILKLNNQRASVEATLARFEFNNDLCFILLWNDVTEKKLREKLMIHNSRMACLGQISAGISHEIKNPLSIIDGTVSLIPKYINQPEQLKSKIDLISSSADRISKIIDGLQKFARISSTKPFSNYSMVRLIKESIMLIETKAKRHSVPIKFEPSFDFEIFCNEVELQQVIVNLLINSIDAIKENTNKWIEIKLKLDPKNIYFHLIDSGNGIQKNISDKIFEPFYTTKSVGEGVGLGLSISKGIVEAHDASISLLEEKPNTTFEIRFKNNQLERHILKEFSESKKSNNTILLTKKVS